ncbi:MAG: amidohydrolase family protein [Nitrososphaeria archaeon]
MKTYRLAGAFIGSDLEFVKNVNIDVDENGIIVDIYERRSGGGSYIALPPLINSHIHTADYAFPETGNWLALEELVAPPNGLKHRLLRATDPEKIKRARNEVAELSRRYGIAALADFVEDNPKSARVKKRGIKHIVLGRPDRNGHIPEGLDGLGLPDVVSYTKEELAYLAEKFRGLPVLVHVSETRRLHEIGDLEVALEYLKPTAIVHGTHLTNDEIRALAESRVSAVLCPRSNLWFSSGIPNIYEMLSNNVLLALGTDNAGWLKPDVWREMEVTALILRHQDPRFNNPTEIIKMATLNPLRIFQLDDTSVRKGNPASFILLDSELLAIDRAEDPAWAVVKRGGPEAVVRWAT